MKFSEKKFKSLSQKSQLKKLLDFIFTIEKNWYNIDKKFELIKEFNNCLKYINNSKYNYLYKINNANNIDYFLKIVTPFIREQGQELRDYDFLNSTKIIKNTTETRKKFPIILILNNLRSTFNVGSIFRTAECLGINMIYLCGYTPTPENPKLLKTSMGTEKHVNWKKIDNIKDVIRDLQKNNFKIYALETTKNALPINKIKYNKQCAILVGNEALGLNESTLELADKVIKIPMLGWKTSLNVSVAMGICLYEIISQLNR